MEWPILRLQMYLQTDIQNDLGAVIYGIIAVVHDCIFLLKK